MKKIVKYIKTFNVKFLARSKQATNVASQSKTPKYLSNRHCYMSTPNAVSAVVEEHFPKFIPYARLHYNAQLDLLSYRPLYYVKNTADEKLDIATDYFQRNRSRLFEWWCRWNDNILTSNDEFNVLKDLYGFNYAFKTMCNKLFGIDIKPDKTYNYGIPMLNEDGSVNHRLWDAIMMSR